MNPQDWTSIFNSKIETLNRTDTWRLEFDDSIIPKHPNPRWQEYIRRTIGSFRCTTCRRTWPSNKGMVIFHMHLENGQGVVKVRPTRQECKRCTKPPMVKPNVDSENIENIMESLMKKIRTKCYKEDLGDQGRFYGHVNVNSPHEPDHCEGCKLGICSMEKDAELMFNKFKSLFTL